jgi:hypothetical protein
VIIASISYHSIQWSIVFIYQNVFQNALDRIRLCVVVAESGEHKSGNAAAGRWQNRKYVNRSKETIPPLYK